MDVFDLRLRLSFVAVTPAGDAVASALLNSDQLAACTEPWGVNLMLDADLCEQLKKLASSRWAYVRRRGCERV